MGGKFFPVPHALRAEADRLALGRVRAKAGGISDIGRGAHPTGPEAGALPETQ